MPKVKVVMIKKSKSGSIKKLVGLFCLTALMFSMFSCNKNGEDKDNTESGGKVLHTVTFNSNGGTPIADIKVEDGRTISDPPTPMLENYVFCRWENNGRGWLFDVKTITSDITLEAQWIAADALFALEPYGDGLEIKAIKRQEEFEKLFIPSVINGKAVLSIGNEAFKGIYDSHAHHIIFPSSITRVGEFAFANSPSTEIIFEGALNYIGESSFDGCAKLESITLANGIESIPFRSFANCTALSTIELPDTVTVIEENSFEGCTALQTVVFPASLRSIENAAFEDCNNIKTVFFKGTSEQYSNISIARGNDKIKTAGVCFYSETKPVTEGRFWHYNANNQPTIW